MEGQTGRVPPHDIEAEKSVLGAMLLDKEAIYVAIQNLRGEDFYVPGNGEIFNAILSLFNSSTPVDQITLTDELNKRGQLEAVGGVGYVADLTTSVGLVAHVHSYCEIVKEKSLLNN